MGYLLDNCLFDRLTSDIIYQCQPYSCEKDADIDSFFHSNTKDNFADYQNEMMGYSHCFYTDVSDYNSTHPESPRQPELVCAFSLSNSALRTAPLPNPKRNRFNKSIPNAKRRSQYPAILIGQLCVFDKFRHLDVGREMMNLIKTLAINPDNTSAARFLVVDALNTPKVLEYYRNNGFDFLFSSDDEEMNCLHKASCPTRLMYFDLIVLNQQF